jgi:hypothetical protein
MAPAADLAILENPKTSTLRGGGAKNGKKQTRKSTKSRFLHILQRIPFLSRIMYFIISFIIIILIIILLRIFFIIFLSS